MSQVPTVTSATPRIYEILYKKGGIAQRAYFKSDSLEKAIALGRKYCEVNHLHFAHVDPWEVDLQELLDRKVELGKTE